MAQRMRIRRKTARGTPKLHRQAAGSSGPTRQQEGAQPSGGLLVGGAMDPAEKRADRIADQVMQMKSPAPLVRRSCAACAEADAGEETTSGDAPLRRKCAACAAKAEAEAEGRVARSPAPVAAATPTLAPGPGAVHAPRGAERAIGALGAGRPLPASERAFFEPRFGRDLSAVRLHDGPAADTASRAIEARAFSKGRDIAFARGAFAPGTAEGRRLMAHELAHVTESGARTPQLRRTPDPLCEKSFSSPEAEKALRASAAAYKASGDADDRMAVVRDLKLYRRCATVPEINTVRALLSVLVGAEDAAGIWQEAGKAFGGYRGAYPGYYGGAKGRLQRLGVSEVAEAETFAVPETRQEFLQRGKDRANDMSAMLQGTDLLYFYGHQYAQYSMPGVFANGAENQAIDLRHIQFAGKSDRVKLIISTSCATICKEALEVFTKAFPKAVILGYRKSAPLHGDTVRNAFDKTITGLRKPLLLDEPLDVSAIISVWKTVIKAQHPADSTRLPGYYRNGQVHYLEQGKWQVVSGADPANSCRKKGNGFEEAMH